MSVGLTLFKWTILLCAGLFACMLILGQDNGQQRLGLTEARNTLATRNTVAPVSVTVAEPAVETRVSVVFAPAKPVIEASPVSDDPVSAQAAPALPVMYVKSNSANLRAGPGKNFNVRARLARGQAVELVPTGLGLGDWVLVRVDGARGYIAASLLTDKAP